ncbi:MAG: hypothetical protein AB7G23_15475 [Vicinamibacterales bacterium]
MTRGTLGLLLALALISPVPALAQGVSVHAAAGPTLGDAGFSVAGGVAVTPATRLTLLGSVELSHLVSRRGTFPGGGVSRFRGGTFTLVSAEVRLSLFARERPGPYGLAGFAVGRSRPNLTDAFPTAASHRVVAPFAGGGLLVPLNGRAAFFADVRLQLVAGTEADDLHALVPLRAGLSWRF